MVRYTVTRLATAIPMLLLLALVVILLAELSPNDPAAVIAGPEASEAAIEEVRQRLGLDQSIPERYLNFITGAIQGDLGRSYVTNEPVLGLVLDRLPRTLSIGLYAIGLSVLISIPGGVLAALRQGKALDRLLTGFCVVLLAIPPFVVAAYLISYLSLGGLRFFPPTGYADLSGGLGEWLRYATLPALAIASMSVAELTRLARGSMVDALAEDYVRTARAKGLATMWIVCKHAGKNAAIPYVTILALQMGRVVGAAVIVEAIFNINGFGKLGVDAVLTHDLPTLQGVVLVSGLLVLVTNLLVDISYGYFNPRMRAR